jgi:hypothetical protein
LIEVASGDDPPRQTKVDELPRGKKAKFEGWPKRLLGTAGVWLAFTVIFTIVFLFAGATAELALIFAAAISIFPALFYLIGGPKSASGLFDGLSGL